MRMNAIENHIKECRIKRGWTQEKLAERIHVGPALFACYEDGTEDPPVGICIDLCAVPDANPQELLGWGKKL